jgi:uncharacterized membrane protein YuzA (DUF378 family)
MMLHRCSGGCAVSVVATVLTVIGGLNWGLTGLGMLIGSNLNVVNLILGGMPVVEAIVYLLVGIAAIALLIGCKCSKCAMACKVDAPKQM